MGFSRNNMVVMTMKSPMVVICKRAAQDWACTSPSGMSYSTTVGTTITLHDCWGGKESIISGLVPNIVLLLKKIISK